jgi:hypothetical protein
LPNVLFGCAFAAIASAASAQTPDSSSGDAAASQESQAPSVEELVKLKQYPVSGLKQIVFQAIRQPELPRHGKTQGIYSLQGVWPFSLNVGARTSVARNPVRRQERSLRVA